MRPFVESEIHHGLFLVPWVSSLLANNKAQLLKKKRYVYHEVSVSGISGG